jgi:hypothetical protein
MKIKKEDYSIFHVIQEFDQTQTIEAHIVRFDRQVDDEKKKKMRSKEKIVNVFKRKEIVNNCVMTCTIFSYVISFSLF